VSPCGRRVVCMIKPEVYLESWEFYNGRPSVTTILGVARRGFRTLITQPFSRRFVRWPFRFNRTDFPSSATLHTPPSLSSQGAVVFPCCTFLLILFYTGNTSIQSLSGNLCHGDSGAPSAVHGDHCLNMNAQYEGSQSTMPPSCCVCSWTSRLSFGCPQWLRVSVV